MFRVILFRDIAIRENDTTDRLMSVFAAELPAGTYVFGSMDSGKNFYSIGAIILPVPDPVNPGDAGLVLHYDFEADVSDMSGNGNDGALLGDAHVMDGLLVLDGEDDAVAIARISGEDAVYSQMSYGMWIYPNVWSHMALTVSDTKVSLFLNGQLEDSRDLAEPLTNLILGSATLGAWGNGDVQREMAGFMDDVVVYDRGLSAAEVQWLAGLRPIPVDPGSEGLVAYYPLDNDANDASGNGLDGTIMGDPELTAGIMGGAMDFDGEGDYIDSGVDASLDIPGPIALALWIRPGADDPEGNGTETAPMSEAMSGISPPWSWQQPYPCPHRFGWLG